MINKKKKAKIVLLGIMMLVICTVIMHSVSASDLGNEEVNKNNGNENTDGDIDSEENQGLENNLILIVFPIIMMTIIIVAIYLNFQKGKPLTTEERVEPAFDPSYQRYDIDTYCSSNNNWSNVNNAWEHSSEIQDGPEYGSIKQQYQDLYSH